MLLGYGREKNEGKKYIIWLMRQGTMRHQDWDYPISDKLPLFISGWCRIKEGKKRILPRAIYNFKHRLRFSSSQRVAKMDQLSLFDTAGPYFFCVWWWKGNSLHSIGSRFNSLKACLRKMCDCYFCKGIDRNCMGSIKVIANGQKVLINKCSYDFRSPSTSPCNSGEVRTQYWQHSFQSHRSSKNIIRQSTVFANGIKGIAIPEEEEEKSNF